MKFDFNYKKVENFNIKENGIQIIENTSTIEIYNDIFRTIPLFITKNKNKEIIIFSNFENFYEFVDVDKTIDIVGFWEIVLFGSGLWTRTLYSKVKQMPSASKIIIDKETNEYRIERYWDFNIKEDKNINSKEKATEGLYSKLDEIFSKLDKNQKYLMGMSGGMDSRITLAFLSKYIPKENLELFTYGFDERLLEYKYACEITKALGYNKPKFHKLTPQSYRKALTYLPKLSGGQIGINHCHIIDYTQTISPNQKYIQISNYFSDALFGYDCVYPKKNENIDENYYVNFLDNIDYLDSTIKNEIKVDAKYIFETYDGNFNYSSLSEYKYFTERNQKFHSYLAYIQNSNLILADYDLLCYMLSVPIEFREQKKIIDYILDTKFKNISSLKFKNISSRDFSGVSSSFTLDSKITGFLDFHSFKFINRVNSVLRILTKGDIQIFNKYQTEEQNRILYKDFSSELKNVTSKLLKMNILNKKQKKYWDKLPLRSNGVSERFQIISLGKLI
jgi:hypothetical protein